MAEKLTKLGRWRGWKFGRKPRREILEGEKERFESRERDRIVGEEV